MKKIAGDIINDYFGGDEDAFMEHLRLESLRTISWKNLTEDSTELSQHDQMIHGLIKVCIGYLPEKPFRINEEIELKKFYEGYKNGEVSLVDYKSQCSKLIRRIRNNHLEEHGISRYNETVFDEYHNFVPELTIAARKRICWIMGYEPDIFHSLKAEILMRAAMVSDQYYFPENDLNEKDLYLANLVRFREIALTQGIEQARQSTIFSNGLMKNKIKILPKKFEDL